MLSAERFCFSILLHNNVRPQLQLQFDSIRSKNFIKLKADIIKKNTLANK